MPLDLQRSSRDDLESTPCREPPHARCVPLPMFLPGLFFQSLDETKLGPIFVRFGSPHAIPFTASGTPGRFSSDAGPLDKQQPFNWPFLHGRQLKQGPPTHQKLGPTSNSPCHTTSVIEPVLMYLYLNVPQAQCQQRKAHKN